MAKRKRRSLSNEYKAEVVELVILRIAPDVGRHLSFSRNTSYGVFPLCAPCGRSLL